MKLLLTLFILTLFLLSSCTTAPFGMVALEDVQNRTNLTLEGDNGGCLMIKSINSTGWTKCQAFNGSLSCSIDADGIC